MNKTLVYFIVPTILIALGAYVLQTKVLLSGDVGYLLYIANQLLEGGTYGKDFLETNPPMILYFYLPACLLAKLPAFNMISAIRVYVFFLSLFSLYFCFITLKQIIKKQDVVVLFILYYALLFIFFFLPTYHFGQREHLLMIAVLPYLFSSTLALESKSIHPVIALIIGIFAGLGFALKPFFLIPFALIELYFIFYKRRLWGWVRIESVTISSIALLYLFSIFIFQPSYINIILPLVSHFYFLGMNDPWSDIFSNLFVILCFMTLFFYFLFYKKAEYHLLSKVLLLTLAGMIAAFLITKTAWYYHVMPAYGLSLLLIALYLGNVISFCLNTKSTGQGFIQEACLLSLISFFIFFVPFKITYQIFNYSIAEKKSGPRQELITYINSLPGTHAVFCFSVHTTEDCFPLVYATHSTYSSRYPFFWWARGLLKLEGYPSEKKALSVSLLQSKHYLYDQLIEDLKHTNLVIINTRASKAILGKDFDFISYFDQDKKFRDMWKNYTYLTTIGFYEIYQRK